MATGLDVKIGHAKGTTWNLAVSVNAANRGLVTTDFTAPSGIGPLIYDNSLTGSGFQANAIRGLVKPNFPLNGNLRYTGLEHMIAMAMGTAGAPVQQGATTAYLHTFQLATNLDGLFDTIAADKVVSIWELPSVKYTGFTLTLTADGLATFSVPIVASSVKVTSGQVNTTLAAVTYRSKIHNVFGTHVKVRGNAASAAALSDSDKIYPSQLTLTYTRNMDGDFVFDQSGIASEPSYTDVPTMTLDLTFPIYGTSAQQQGNSFFTNAAAETAMKLDITMTSPQLAGVGFPYSITIEIPNAVIADPQAPVNGPGKIPTTTQLAMIEASAAPLGMTGLTKPFRWLQISGMSTDALLTP
jgi:hypothetical protein